MKQCNFQNSYGVIAYRKVCASIFNFFVDTHNFPIRVNLYQILRFFVIFEAIGPHF